MPAFELGNNLYTDTFEINVGYSKPDSTNVLRDIKPIIAPEEETIKWYYILIGVLLIVLLIWSIIRNIIKNKKKKPQATASKINAIDEALASLKKIKTNNLSTVEEIKLFHTALSDVFKNYLNRTYQNIAVGKTTSSILVSLSIQSKNTELIAKAASALRCNDAVKFAKYFPDNNQSKECFEQIKNSILQLEAEKMK